MEITNWARMGSEIKFSCNLQSHPPKQDRIWWHIIDTIATWTNHKDSFLPGSYLVICLPFLRLQDTFSYRSLCEDGDQMQNPPLAMQAFRATACPNKPEEGGPSMLFSTPGRPPWGSQACPRSFLFRMACPWGPISPPWYLPSVPYTDLLAFRDPAPEL